MSGPPRTSEDIWSGEGRRLMQPRGKYLITSAAVMTLQAFSHTRAKSSAHTESALKSSSENAAFLV